MGSELTTATMKSAGRALTEVCACAAKETPIAINNDKLKGRKICPTVRSDDGALAGCAGREFRAEKLVIVGESAGRRQVFAKVLVTGDIVAQCFQGARANSG